MALAHQWASKVANENIRGPSFSAIHHCAWGLRPGEPWGVLHCLLSFLWLAVRLVIKAATSICVIHSGSILWLALQLSSTVYCLIPPTACTAVDILIPYNSRLRWGFIAIRPGISAGKEKRLNRSGNIQHPQFSSFYSAAPGRRPDQLSKALLLLNSSLWDWPLLLTPVLLVLKHPVSTFHS